MNIDYSTLFTPGTITLVALLFVWAARVLAKKFLSKTEIETLMLISSVAVESAEQLAKIGILAPDKRYRMAIDLIVKEMAERGFNPSLELIASAIESCVLMVNNSQIPVFEIEGEREQTID